MGRSKTDIRLTYSQSVICSGVAGITSHTITAPFDVVKILAQVGTADASGFGMLRTFRNVHVHEGLRGFWKGNLMGCMRLFPYSAIQFSAFQKMKLKAVDSQGRLSPMFALTCGAGGGVIATVAMYPTDTVKTRLIVQRFKSSYRGIFNAFAVIIRTEGIFTLYKGMSVAILGENRLDLWIAKLSHYVAVVTRPRELRYGQIILQHTEWSFP
jgi:solute carrier family 25 protein 43